MHATQIINTHLKTMCQAIHKQRMKALMSMVEACIQGKKLSVTGLGRAIKNSVYEKHNIKRADRLMGNLALNQERGLVYQMMGKWIIGNQKQPVILIDWSDLSTNRSFHLLRASLPVGGRALTLYDEVHPEKKLGNGNIEKRFLQHLRVLLPKDCCPIIITDAGYRTPWFNAVQALGWDFVGRVGGHTMITPQTKEDWIRVEQVFETATTQPRYLGFIDLVKRNPTPCHAYLVKKKKQGRVKKTVFGKRCEMKHSEKNAHRERTPWLIVTSLTGGKTITKRVINLYKTRMQIEEGFRDIKSNRWGFSLDEAKVSTKFRYENLLLVGVLATFSVWLTGQVAELKNVHRQYQANTIKKRNVLSIFYLGCCVLNKQVLDIKRKDFQQALVELQYKFEAQCYA